MNAAQGMLRLGRKEEGWGGDGRLTKGSKKKIEGDDKPGMIRRIKAVRRIGKERI